LNVQPGDVKNPALINGGENMRTTQEDWTGTSQIKQETPSIDPYLRDLEEQIRENIERLETLKGQVSTVSNYVRGVKEKLNRHEERLNGKDTGEEVDMFLLLSMSALIRNGEIDEQEEIKDVVKTLVDDMGMKKKYVAGLIGKSERTVYRYLDGEKEE